MNPILLAARRRESVTGDWAGAPLAKNFIASGIPAERREDIEGLKLAHYRVALVHVFFFSVVMASRGFFFLYFFDMLCIDV